MNCIITIDGPAGSGKSTVSRLLAKRLGFLYLDTGAMYRAVALAAKIRGLSMIDTEKMKTMCQTIELRFVKGEKADRLFLGSKDVSKDIRTPEMDMLSSKVSSLKIVRDAMTDLQRDMAKDNDVVAEGRDMGTVVFPMADHKFFLTASPDIRAKRRYIERIELGEEVAFDSVSADIRKRDKQDQSRAIAPLKAAQDAIVIDSTDLNIGDVLDKILKHIDLGKQFRVFLK